MVDRGSRQRGTAWAFAFAAVLGGCRGEMPPAPQLASALRDGVTQAESLAVQRQHQGATGRPSLSTESAGTCTIAWSAPDSVSGCNAPVPTVAPAVPWLVHDGEALGPGEIEQRDSIHIGFGLPVKGLTLTSTGALNCSGTLGTLIGYRHDTLVAEADNALTDPADCGTDDVTFGVTGQFPPDSVIDSLVIVGVDPWTFPVFNLTGRAWLKYTLTYAPLNAEPTSVVIESVHTANAGSFTTLPDERTITMTAVTVPASLADSVHWTVTDYAGDQVPSIPPDSDSLARGAAISWRVPKQDSVRWHAFSHPGTLNQKSLAYVIVASVTDATGATVHSAPDTLKQDETDTMREEYIELVRDTVPTRDRFGMAQSPHFLPGGLNSGDYSRYIAEPVLLNGLEALRSKMGSALGQETPLQITSGYRNPVHHSVHDSLPHPESTHEYGVAADLRIVNQAESPDRFFEYLRKAAKDPSVRACLEPAEAIRNGNHDHSLNHAHVDWRATCPKNW